MEGFAPLCDFAFYVSAMTAEELRSLQAPLKERYRDQPQSARMTLKAEGRLGEGVSCNVATSKALIAAGLASCDWRQRHDGVFGRYVARSVGRVCRCDARGSGDRDRYRNP